MKHTGTDITYLRQRLEHARTPSRNKLVLSSTILLFCCCSLVSVGRGEEFVVVSHKMYIIMLQV